MVPGRLGKGKESDPTDVLANASVGSGSLSLLKIIGLKISESFVMSNKVFIFVFLVVCKVLTFEFFSNKNIGISVRLYNTPM